MLTCNEFEQTWNDRLDARTTGVDGRLSALETHAAVCVDCRAIHARYIVLTQAIQELAPIAVPSAGLTEGVLTAWSAQSRRPLVSRLPIRLAALAAAAVLVVGMTLGLRYVPSKGSREQERLVTAPVDRAPGGFTWTLADVTSATLDLARETSGPAARVGRDVLASADLPVGPTSVDAALSLPLSLPVDVPSSDVWQRVGDRLNAGVRPLEGSALRAFSFLRVAPGDPKPAALPSPGA